MHFTRKISVKHHPNGDHYSVSVPREIAQALGLQDGGGLVSIELPDIHKKGSYAFLKAYRDSDFAWREHSTRPTRTSSKMNGLIDAVDS